MASVTLSWSAAPATDNVSAYQIWGANGSSIAFGSCAKLATVAALTWTDIGLPNAQARTYYIVAVNAAGSSSPEGPINITTAAAGTVTVTESFVIAASDETTALTTGDKVTFRIPYALTLTSVKASLTTAQTSGSIFTVDVKKGGSTIFSTKPTIDNTEKTTATAVTASVLSTTALANDDEIVVNINQIGDGTAKGLKVVLIGHQ